MNITLVYIYEAIYVYIHIEPTWTHTIVHSHAYE